MGVMIDRYLHELPSIEAWLDWGYTAEAGEDGRSRSAGITAQLENLYTISDLLRHRRARLETALTSAQRCGDPQSEANVQKALGDLALREADLAQARTRYEAALRIYPAIGDRLGEANVQKALGDLALREDDLAQARTRYEAALRIYPAIGDRLGEANVLQGLGNIALAEKDPAAAFAKFRAAYEAHQAIGDRLGMGADLGYMGRAAENAGNAMQATLLHDASLAIHRQIGERLGQVLNLKDEGDAFWQLNAQQPALAAWWRAREIAHAIGTGLAKQLDNIFMQVAEALGPEGYAKLEAELHAHAEEWRQAGVEAMEKEHQDQNLGQLS